MKILRLSEYADAVGKYHVHSEDLVGSGLNWLIPARVLGMDIPTFLLMLKNEYQAELIIYKEKDKVKFVGYKWDELLMARKFKNYVNRIAREKRITVEGILNGKV